MMMIISGKSKTGEPMRCGDLHEIMGASKTLGTLETEEGWDGIVMMIRLVVTHGTCDWDPSQ